MPVQVIIIGGAHAGAAHSEMNDGDETCRFIQVREVVPCYCCVRTALTFMHNTVCEPLDPFDSH